jgi:hypothetical protein
MESDFESVATRARRNWNQMTSDDRYRLLLHCYPACEAVSKISLQKWGRISDAVKGIIVSLMCEAGA